MHEICEFCKMLKIRTILYDAKNIFFLTRALAEQFRSIFSAFPYFNFVQSKVLDDVCITHTLFLFLLF